MGNVIEHEPVLIVNGEGPEGAIIGILKSRRVAALCRIIGGTLVKIVGQLRAAPPDSSTHRVLIKVVHTAGIICWRSEHAIHHIGAKRLH